MTREETLPLLDVRKRAARRRLIAELAVSWFCDFTMKRRLDLGLVMNVELLEILEVPLQVEIRCMVAARAELGLEKTLKVETGGCSGPRRGKKRLGNSERIPRDAVLARSVTARRQPGGVLGHAKGLAHLACC